MKRLVAPAVLLLIVVGFYWKLTLSGQYTWLGGTDLAYQVLPWFQHQAGEWQSGRFPLWDPYQWAGQPLLGQAQPGTAYPLNWLLFLAPGYKGWIRHTYLNWYFVLIHFQAALFLYWFCRDLRRSRAGSVLAASVFALGGYIGGIDWPQMLNGAVWGPLVMLFLFRAMRGERPVASAALAGGFLGIALLSGHHQAPVFLALASAGLLLWMLISQPDRRPRSVAAGGAFALTASLAGGFQMLPAIEYGRQSLRWVSALEPVGWGEKVPYYVHAQFATPASGLAGFVIGGYQGHLHLFIGVTAFAMAAAACLLRWPDPAVRILAMGALGMLVLSFGPATPLHGVLYSLAPWVEKARNPSMASSALHVFLAPLVAFGLDAALEGASKLRMLRLVLAIAGSSLLFVLLGLVMSGKTAPDANSSFAMAALAAIVTAALLRALDSRILGPRAAAAALIALSLVELSGAVAFTFRHVRDKEAMKALAGLAEPWIAADYLARTDPLARVEVDSLAVPHNAGDWYGFQASAGYMASLTRNIERLHSHNPRVKGLLGVKYLLAEKPGAGERLALDAPGRLKVFERDAFPRVWTVHETDHAPDAEALRARLHDEAYDLRTRAPMLNAPPALERCAEADNARIVRWNPGEVEIVARMACRGLVVLSDIWFPGWSATVDRRPAEIHEVYGALRAVVADSGTHVVRMRYRPGTAVAGAAMSLLGLLTMLGIWRWVPW